MSTTLNVVLGMVLVFLVFSIVVTGVQEWWAQIRKLRGQYLHYGLTRLLDDEAIFVRVLQHPLVSGLSRQRSARGTPPSYLEASNFSLALASVVVQRAAAAGAPPVAGAVASAAPGVTALVKEGLTATTLRAALASLAAQRSPVASALLPIVDSANKDLETMLHGIEAWFNAGMDRVGGWYKAHSQKTLFVIGLLVASIANVDSIAIFQALNRSPELAQNMADAAATVAKTKHIDGVDVAALKERSLTDAEMRNVGQWFHDLGGADSTTRLPIGYDCLAALIALPAAGDGDPAALRGTNLRAAKSCRSEWSAMWTDKPSAMLLRILGWIITALAGVLGAPYWFGLLEKVVNIRGSGAKPDTTKTEK